ncbi:LysR family transcriptional regulator [Ramlibacter sp. AW1]|uniref:LysR family transcriptional regulator n=1 Tax=Ramlibacter aurantiacus TaxID=2801330 RepID=A0A936ZGM4_9BURK|nr:LysR substrate-binding domain-containing protein [Ramlibacter aurantiacus]MBL0421074.1 LysR family transcriptional regulator [Ramlibacter aurantiacus]
MQFQRRHLQVLVAIEDAGSMHKAAQQLGMAQPAVSRLLAEIERALGMRIFERGAGGSTPTRRAEALLAQARATLGGLLRMDEIASGHGGSIRFGCIPRAIHTLMPFLLPRLGPLRLQLVEDGSPALLSALERGAVDMAVVRHVAGAAGIGGALQALRLYDEAPTVICSAHHPLARRRTLALSSLGEQAWVLPASGTTTRALLDRFWQHTGLTPLQPVLETRSFEASVALVADTELLAIIPDSIARMHERAGRIRRVRVTPTLPGTAVMLVFDAAAPQDPVLAACRDLVLDAAVQARRAYALGA